MISRPSRVCRIRSAVKAYVHAPLEVPKPRPVWHDIEKRSDQIDTAAIRWVLGGLLLVLTLPTFGIAYGEGPPLARTGGFGEPSCLECHTDRPLNDPGGSLTVMGLPAMYVPGTDYRIDVILSRRGLRRGGFELAARFSSGTEAGRQAGVIEAVNAAVEVATQDETAIQYARHNAMGSFSRSGDSFTWSMLWQAPSTAEGPVTIHVAANASDDDSTELGDWIYMYETTIPNEGARQGEAHALLPQ